MESWNRLLKDWNKGDLNYKYISILGFFMIRIIDRLIVEKGMGWFI